MKEFIGSEPKPIARFENYQQAVTRTFSDDFDLAQAALGLGGETGECLELVKKHRQHGLEKSQLRGQLREELGDVLWYLAAICCELRISLQDVAEENIRKLEQRYPNGFRKKEIQ